MNYNYPWKNCTRCTLETDSYPLACAGSPQTANAMLVDFQPTRDELISDNHFEGHNGMLLNNMLASVGLSRKDFYFTKLVKCRFDDGADSKVLGTCNDWLQGELTTVAPKAILVLGGDAAKAMFGSSFAITKDRGIRDWKGYPVCVTYHPSYLMRFPSLAVMSPRWQAWRDLIDFKFLLDSLLAPEPF